MSFNLRQKKEIYNLEYIECVGKYQHIYSSVSELGML